MTCKHGFIGACAECDGSGQVPEPEEEREPLAQLTGTPMQWRVHTSNLLQEIFSNQGTGMLARPIQILGRLLAEVGERARELNDPQLNVLMLRLTIYSAADPTSEDYDPDGVEEYIRENSR